MDTFSSPEEPRPPVRYVENHDPMWEEHMRTVDSDCVCDYSKIQNGLWETLAIRREVDRSCSVHFRG